MHYDTFSDIEPNWAQASRLDWHKARHRLAVAGDHHLFSGANAFDQLGKLGLGLMHVDDVVRHDQFLR